MRALALNCTLLLCCLQFPEMIANDSNGNEKSIAMIAAGGSSGGSAASNVNGRLF